MKNSHKILFAIFFLGIVSVSCSVKPEPLVIGKDACYTCKMTLVDNKFGAEIVTKKGKIYKFDDMNCMLNFIHSGYEQKENISSYLVTDYNDPTQLLNAKQAVYVESELVKSPMNGNIAAFSSNEKVKKFNSEWKGKITTWRELSIQFK